MNSEENIQANNKWSLFKDLAGITSAPVVGALSGIEPNNDVVILRFALAANLAVVDAWDASTVAPNLLQISVGSRCVRYTSGSASLDVEYKAGYVHLWLCGIEVSVTKPIPKDELFSKLTEEDLGQFGGWVIDNAYKALEDFNA